MIFDDMLSSLFDPSSGKFYRIGLAATGKTDVIGYLKPQLVSHFEKADVSESDVAAFMVDLKDILRPLAEQRARREIRAGLRKFFPPEVSDSQIDEAIQKIRFDMFR